MTMVKRSAFALILLISAAGVSPAFAADEPPVVAGIMKNWESQYKVKPTYQSLTTESDGSVVINGLSVQLPVPPDGTVPLGKVAFSVGQIKLSGIIDQGNGLFDVAQAQYNDIKVEIGSTEAAFTMTVPQSSAEHWYVKVLGDNPTPSDIVRASMSFARKITSGKVTLAAGGQTFSADGSEMTWDGDPVTGAGKTNFKMSNIAIPESAIAAIDPSGTLKKLGYASLSFDVGGNGRFDVASDKMAFDFDVFYAGKDIGTLKVGGAAGEIPMALIAQMKEMQTQAQPDPAKYMPLVQGIQVSRVTLRFEDQSITKKVLPMIAAMQGMDEATMVANTGAMLQLGLAELKNPAFTQKAVEAVGAFLKDPRSITILAKPAQPITVMQLMSLDPANPGAAIDQLGVSIAAND